MSPPVTPPTPYVVAFRDRDGTKEDIDITLSTDSSPTLTPVLAALADSRSDMDFSNCVLLKVPDADTLGPSRLLMSEDKDDKAVSEKLDVRPGMLSEQ